MLTNKYVVVEMWFFNTWLFIVYNLLLLTKFQILYDYIF